MSIWIFNHVYFSEKSTIALVQWMVGLRGGLKKKTCWMLGSRFSKTMNWSVLLSEKERRKERDSKKRTNYREGRCAKRGGKWRDRRKRRRLEKGKKEEKGKQKKRKKKKRRNRPRPLIGPKSYICMPKVKRLSKLSVCSFFDCLFVCYNTGDWTHDWCLTRQVLVSHI